MYFQKSILVIFFTFLHVSRQEYDGLDTNTLQLVQVFHRHGEKNPEHVYPNDPYNDEKYWPGGWGQLTQLGVSQANELGRFLRRRYGGFVSTEYDQYEIYVISSDTERTIRSALGNLARFYNLNSTGNPVPIRTAVKDVTNLFGNIKMCPNYKTAADDFKRNSDMMKPINEENKPIFDYINEHSGLNITISDKQLTDFHDTLQFEDRMQYPLPNWTQSLYNSTQIIDLIALGFRLNAINSKFQRFLSGPLLHLIQNNLIAKTDISKNITSMSPSPFPFMHDFRRKMITFSGHDTNMAYLMTTLGVYEDIRPPFASALLLELHRNTSTGGYYLELWFRNDTTKEPYFLPLKTDSKKTNNIRMAMKDFLRYIEPLVIIPEEWRKECNSDTNLQSVEYFKTGNDRSGILQYFLGALLGISLMILALLLAKTFKMHKRRGYIPFEQI